MGGERRAEKEAEKMEEQEEEEHSPSITLIHNFEGEEDPPKTDGQPIQVVQKLTVMNACLSQ